MALYGNADLTLVVATCSGELVNEPSAAIRLIPSVEWAADVLGPLGQVSCAQLGYERSRVLLKNIAERAKVFLPKYALTARELNARGPGHCFREECVDGLGRKRALSFSDYCLGCVECGYYVCGCGYCLCDCSSDRWNYLGQPYPKGGRGSGIVPNKRAVFVNVARHLAVEIARAFPDSPLIRGRLPRCHANRVFWPDQDYFSELGPAGRTAGSGGQT